MEKRLSVALCAQMCAGALSRSKTGLHDLQDAQDCVVVCAVHDTSARRWTWSCSRCRKAN